MTVRIVLTGATGKVGSRVSRRLLGQGHSVVALVRRDEAAQEVRRLGAEPALGDLRQPETLRSVVARAEAVLHFAAFFRGATEAEARAVNLDGTVALARACVAAGVPRLLFASTTMVYGPPRERPAGEDDPVAPTGVYPASKAEAEHVLLAVPGLVVHVLRLAFVYGDGDSHLAEALPFWRKMEAGERIQLVHHADVAQAFVRALGEPGARTGRIYNVADDAPTTVGEILQTLGEEPSPEAAAPAGAWGAIADTTRIRAELNFRPSIPTLWAAREAGAL